MDSLASEQFESALTSQPKKIYSLYELASDRIVRARAANFAGSLVVGSMVEIDDNQPSHSLLDSIRQAAQGDSEALKLIEANVSTDVLERTIKTGFTTPKSYLEIDNQGHLYQFGQSYHSIQANSLVLNQHHAIMSQRTAAENRNGFRIEDLLRQQAFDDYSMVVFSMAEDLPDCGFFTANMSCSIQLTSKDQTGIAIESAFVAGKNKYDDQFDRTRITAIYQQLAGIDISNLTAAEVIDRPLLIANELIPNGVVDLVKLYDQTGHQTFYGLDQPEEDYLKHQQACADRAAKYQTTSSKIINQLIKRVHQLNEPVDATRLLNELSERYTVELAINDRLIDPSVFGGVSAFHIYQARQAMISGLYHEAEQALVRAITTASSSSCPTAPSEERAVGQTKEDKYGSLTFYCTQGHLNNRPRNVLIDKCQVCSVSVKC